MENPFEIIIRKLDQIDDRLASLEKAIPTRTAVSDEPPFLNIHAAAKYLGRTPNALRMLLSKGKIKAIKKGNNRNYFEREYLKSWMTE